MQSEVGGKRGLLECSLAELSPVTIGLVGDQQSWQRWKQVVERYHYLGVKQPTGRRLHYLVYAGQEPIGALGWKGSSLKLRARDCFVGWNEGQRGEPGLGSPLRGGAVAAGNIRGPAPIRRHGVSGGGVASSREEQRLRQAGQRVYVSR